MAERKNTSNVDEVEKPTKEEYAVARFLRFNVPTKEAKLQDMEVQCFAASAAVDALMESKWSASQNAQEALFVNRNSCVSYCQRLLEKGLFHRAERVQRKKEKDKEERSKKKKVKDAAEKEDGGTGDELRERKIQKEKEEDDVEKITVHESEEVEEEKKTEEKQKEKKEKKDKPMKLLMTDDQMFEDGDQNIYVWIYDPANAQTLMIGGLIVFGVAALCLFPLWPYWVRVGVYYFSITAAGFVGFILSLVVLRLILFCAVWLLTLGRHHFWLLPNLTEDVSIMESFQPLYTHKEVLPESSASGKTYTKSRSGKRSKGKAKKKDKSSDAEDSGSDPEFEMVHRGDVEEDDDEGRLEGEEDSEENGEAREEEEYGAEEEEEEDYGEEEEDQNDGGLEEEEEDQELEEEEDSGLKKDK